MSDRITFTLDGQEVEAAPGETIWQVARRQGTLIPHLCHRDEHGYRAEGDCRACVVGGDDERTLTASCIREPTQGMVVSSHQERAKLSRYRLTELLLTDQPNRV